MSQLNGSVKFVHTMYMFLNNSSEKKTQKTSNEVSLESFKTSNGWLRKFRELHNISFRNICDGSKSVDRNVIIIMFYLNVYTFNVFIFVRLSTALIFSQQWTLTYSKRFFKFHDSSLYNLVKTVVMTSETITITSMIHIHKI